MRNTKVTLTRDSDAFATTTGALDEFTDSVKIQLFNTQHNV